MNREGKRPSPALVISLLALFVALGGTGYAALSINGKDIRKGTVAGSKLKKNTLTGKQIKESGLGKVPRAANADRLGGKSASAFADSSQFLDTYTQATRGSEKTILDRGPFKLTLVCSGGSAGNIPVAQGKIRVDVSKESVNSITSPGLETLLPAGSSFETAATSFAAPAQNSNKLVGGYIDTANGKTLDFTSRIRLNMLGNSWCDAVTQATFGGF